MISEEGESAIVETLKRMKEKYGNEFMITGIDQESVEEYIKEYERKKEEEK